MKTVSLVLPIQLAMAPEAVWRFVRDTDRLNRELGLPPISFVPSGAGSPKGHFRGRAPVGPFHLDYEEFPFEWMENRFFHVRRRFDNGPTREIRGGLRLRPAGEGTSVEIWAEADVRIAVLAPAVGWVLRRVMLTRLAGLLRDFEARSRAQTVEPMGLRRPPEVNRPQLEARLRVLRTRGFDVDMIDRLAARILTGSELEVARMRPFDLADEWRKDRLDVLRFLLHATREGVTNLQWSVLCPHCHGGSTVGELKALAAQSACDTCDRDFRSDLSETVELSFLVNSGIRRARSEIYCIGGPANQPRLAAQCRLDAGEKRAVTWFVRPGIISVRSIPGDDAITVKVDASPSTGAELALSCRERTVVAAAPRIGSGDVVVRFENTTGSERLVTMEQANWKANAATAAIVTTLQEFRELFPGETVAPGLQIDIGRLTLLFTDLTGSTKMYRSIGDVRAFGFVQKHFRFLTDVVSRYNGGLVKTMGDAIMATFASARDAMEAAAAMQEQWRRFLREHPEAPGAQLKVGVHQGASIAINNAGATDYFGTTVNMAARVQHQAKAGEIVFTDSVYEDPEVQAFLRATRAKPAPFSAELKGLSGRRPLFRLRASPVARRVPRLKSA